MASNHSITVRASPSVCDTEGDRFRVQFRNNAFNAAMGPPSRGPQLRKPPPDPNPSDPSQGSLHQDPSCYGDPASRPSLVETAMPVMSGRTIGGAFGRVERRSSQTEKPAAAM